MITNIFGQTNQTTVTIKITFTTIVTIPQIIKTTTHTNNLTTTLGIMVTDPSIYTAVIGVTVIAVIEVIILVRKKQ